MLSWASNLVRTPPRRRVPTRTPTRLAPCARQRHRVEGPKAHGSSQLVQLRRVESPKAHGSSPLEPASTGRGPEGTQLVSAGAGVGGTRTRRNSTRLNRCWCGREENPKELDSNQPAALHGGLTAPRMAAPAQVRHRPDVAIYLSDILLGLGAVLSWLMNSPRVRAASPRLRKPSSDSDPVSPSCESLT